MLPSILIQMTPTNYLPGRMCAVQLSVCLDVDEVFDTRGKAAGKSKKQNNLFVDGILVAHRNSTNYKCFDGFPAMLISLFFSCTKPKRHEQ